MDTEPGPDTSLPDTGTDTGSVGIVAENVGKRGSTWFYRVDLPPAPGGRRC